VAHFLIVHLLLCSSCALPGATECSACPVGKIPSTNAHGCVDCGVGKYRDPNTFTCVDCALGTYSYVGGQESNCPGCPIGRYGPIPLGPCEYCPSGQVQAATGQVQTGTWLVGWLVSWLVNDADSCCCVLVVVFLLFPCSSLCSSPFSSLLPPSPPFFSLLLPSSPFFSLLLPSPPFFSLLLPSPPFFSPHPQEATPISAANVLMDNIPWPPP
jgi:hypothetical protein